MGIRKFKKGMKPLIFVFVVAFVLTIGAGLFSSFGTLTGGNYALKLNGKKVDIIKIERAFQIGVNNFKQQYGEAVNVDELKLLIFNNVLEQELLLQDAKKLKVKISDKELDEQMAKIEGQFPDTATFDKALQAQGFTKDTLKKELEEKLQLDKVKEKIESEAKVTEEELKANYEENKYNSFFVGKTFDGTKKEIEESLLGQKKAQVLRAWLEKKVKEAKYKFPKINKQVNPYEILKAVVVYEKEGFSFTNVDLANRKIMSRVQGVSDEAALDKMAKEGIDKELKVVTKGKALGLKIDENLSQADKITAYGDAYQKYLVANTKITDAELQGYFVANGARYDIPETYDVQVIELAIKAGAKDEEIAKVKTEGILKEALAANADFSELAKKYSEDGSAAEGGYLGWFKKEQMVAPFAEAAFAGEKGKVVPKVVKSEFGYHIIKVENKKADGSEVEARHILITFKVGPDTIQATHTKAAELAEKLKAGKITFEAAAKEWSLTPDKFNFTGIKKGEPIKDLGQDVNLSKALETAKVNEVALSIAERAFIYKVTKHTPFKAADFATVKNRVLYDMTREKVGGQLQALFQ